MFAQNPNCKLNEQKSIQIFGHDVVGLINRISILYFCEIEYIYLFILCVCMPQWTWGSKEQLAGVCSLLSSWGSWG